ncbi:hypothetical protein L7F22_052574 [Adiantum nelumboides]|nr:hypothetical protein [Adiantum nelumboides]
MVATMKVILATMMVEGKVATRIAFGSAEANHFIEVKFVGGNRCGDQDSKVLGHAEKEDVLDKEAEPDAKVEIVEGYNCEEQDPSVEVHVEKEGVLEKDSFENGDQVENCPSMKNNEVSARDTSPSILQTIQMMQRERKRRMTGEDMEIIIKKSEPPQEIGDASVEAGGDANCAVGAGGAGEDMEIISKKFEPPQENDDALVNASMDASEDAVCAGGAGGVGGVGEDTAEPPQENSDPSVDVGGDSSCAGGAIGASAAKYVRHNDGTVSHPWDDGGDARGVAGYVRNNDGTVPRPWEDPRNILFESKPAIIFDINGVLLTSVDKMYCSQMPTYWSGLEIVDKAGVFAGYKRDAPAFLDWCLVHFDVFVWTCMKNKAEKMLRACFPAQFHQFKEILAQQDWVKDARFKLTGGKPVFYKKISDFWDKRAQYTATSTILVDDTQYK